MDLGGADRHSEREWWEGSVSGRERAGRVKPHLISGGGGTPAGTETVATKTVTLQEGAGQIFSAVVCCLE